MIRKAVIAGRFNWCGASTSAATSAKTYWSCSARRNKNHIREASNPSKLAAALFRLENSRSAQDIQQIVKELIQWLKAPEQKSLQRAFTVWLRRVLLPGRLKDVALPELNELHEVEAMLSERVKEWTREWKEEGLQQGRQEGIQLGEAAVLLRQIEIKFGPLNKTDRQKIQAADINTLLQ